MSIESERAKDTAVEPNTVHNAEQHGEFQRPGTEPAYDERGLGAEQEFGRQGLDADQPADQRLHVESEQPHGERPFPDAEPTDTEVTNGVVTGERVENNGGQSIPGAPDTDKLREQWREVQTTFVDDPRDAVTRADDLVSGALQQLTDGYAQRLQELESRWSSDNDTDTEALRQALRGYRDLFDQLVKTASAGGATNM